MISEDSFTEDDSFINLYSTQRITSTYNTLLEKIKSANKATKNDNKEIFMETTSVECNDDECDMLTDRSRRDDMYLTDEPVCIDEESPTLRRSARIRKSRPEILSDESDLMSPPKGKRSRKKSKNKLNEAAEMITLSDDESDCSDLNLSLDDDTNYEVSVKVMWKSVSVETFRLRRFQKFTKIFQHFMEREKLPMEKIFLSLKNTKITPNDTPESINLKVFDFIDGGTLTDSTSVTSEMVTNEKCKNDKESITVKVQDEKKKMNKFSVNKNECLKSVMMRYAEQIEMPLTNMKFYFDGELIKHSDTPASLGLDQDEIIDVKIV